MLIQSAVYLHLLIGAVLIPIPEIKKKTSDVKLLDILDKLGVTFEWWLGLQLSSVSAYHN